MQTTLRLDERLLGAAKRAALSRGESLNAFMVAAVRQEVIRQPRRRASRPARLATYRGRGLQAGVNLDDSEGLLEHMEGRG
jgi:hypothetical protein